jgi:hypothetical protein
MEKWNKQKERSTMNLDEEEELKNHRLALKPIDKDL